MKKEVGAGAAMGAILGLLVYGLSLVWSGFSAEVGLAVAISLPLVSLWANLLGGVLPLASQALGFNPAVVSAPLMTTVVDATGLAIYFLVAKMIIHL